MSPKGTAQSISVYVPEKARRDGLVERLTRLGKVRDRSINYLVVEAILQYLDRHGG